MTNLIKYDDKPTLFPVSSFGRQIDHFFGDVFSDMDRSLFKHPHAKKRSKNF